MSAPLYFILMVCLTILLNLALSGYNVVVLRRIIDGIGLPHRMEETQGQTARQTDTDLNNQQRMALAFGVGLAAFLRIGLTLILSDLLTFSYVRITAGLLLLWTSWRLFRSLSAPAPAKESARSADLSEAILKIIIADLALGLDNILAVACVSIHHHAILISGLTISILALTLAVMLAPALLLRLRWMGWLGMIIMIGLSLHLLSHGLHDVHFPFFH